MTVLGGHTFLGTTQSLCPECLTLVPAKIITTGRRVTIQRCQSRVGRGRYHNWMPI
jgi:uncharacterized radical SAM superfamily Fe-S cluster-containing enzyme